jgi:hypothetical protein
MSNIYLMWVVYNSHGYEYAIVRNRSAQSCWRDKAEAERVLKRLNYWVKKGAA